MIARISVLLPAPLEAQAEHGDELAVSHCQADLVQHFDAPVARRKLPDLKDGGHCTTLTLPPLSIVASSSGFLVMPAWFSGVML